MALDDELIRIDCPECGGRIKFPLSFAGKSALCPLCREPVELADARSQASPHEGRTPRLRLIAVAALCLLLAGGALVFTLIRRTAGDGRPDEAVKGGPMGSAPALATPEETGSEPDVSPFEVADPKWGRTILSGASEDDAKQDFRKIVAADLPEVSVMALQTFFTARIAYEKEDYQRARDAFVALWRRFPRAGPEWGIYNRMSDPYNIGHPPVYYAILMLQDCVNWRLEEQKLQTKPVPKTIVLSVILPGKAEGIVSRLASTSSGKQDEFISQELDPRLLADDYRIIRESVWLLTEYFTAISQGTMRFELQVVHLPNLTIPSKTTETRVQGGRIERKSSSTAVEPWSALPPGVFDRTDWWWLILPSHAPWRLNPAMPTDFPDSGMGFGPRNLDPRFFCNDVFLLERPANLGRGTYTAVERSVYLPQWLQHEIFHHLVSVRFVEFRLEAKPHQWFDRKTWPRDFRGRFEPDYIQESVFKRIQSARPTMKDRLSYRGMPPRR